MQAIETDRSPGLPSLIVTTRLRLIPRAPRSALQAVTQALHSMQRSASQTHASHGPTFSRRSDLAEQLWVPACRLPGRAVGGELFTLSPSTSDRPFGYCCAGRPPGPAGKVIRHPRQPLLTRSVTSAFIRFGIVGNTTQTQPVLDAALCGVGRLISTNISCRSSASHLLERVSRRRPHTRPNARKSGSAGTV